MNDYIEFIEDLVELRSLYAQGDLRQFDFDSKLARYQGLINQFEQGIVEDPAELNNGVYQPQKEA